MLFYAEFLTGSSSCRHALNVPPLDPSCKINIKRAGLLGWWAGGLVLAAGSELVQTIIQRVKCILPAGRC